MFSMCSALILLSSVSVCVLTVSSDSVLSDTSACESTLQRLHGGQVTVHIPPNITGHWVSNSCEVRPGPEFITRSYRFHPDHSFTALQFHYEDGACREPSYSLRVRGRVHPLRGSWRVRGGTVCELELSGVELRCHGAVAAARVQRLLQAGCDLRHTLSPGRSYELWAPAGPDCTRGLDFSMQELLLVRLERRRLHGDPGRRAEELFLGDVHTERAQRRLHTPAGYQSPLQRDKAEGCVLCALIASADLHHPPRLPPRPDWPVRLHGDWVSQRCEVRPGVLFLTRHLSFHEDEQTWDGRYEHFSDPACRHPTFSIAARGRYSRGAASESIAGAVEFTFTVTHMSVTPMDAATASLLNRFRGRSCGASGSWVLGVPQDVTVTGGCAALGVRLPHTEFELFSAGRDASGRSLLFNGQRPSDGSSPDQPSRRPSSFQPPLARCSAPQDPRGERLSDGGSRSRAGPVLLIAALALI